MDGKTHGLLSARTLADAKSRLEEYAAPWFHELLDGRTAASHHAPSSGDARHDAHVLRTTALVHLLREITLGGDRGEVLGRWTAHLGEGAAVAAALAAKCSKAAAAEYTQLYQRHVFLGVLLEELHGNNMDLAAADTTALVVSRLHHYQQPSFRASMLEIAHGASAHHDEHSRGLAALLLWLTSGDLLAVYTADLLG